MLDRQGREIDHRHGEVDLRQDDLERLRFLGCEAEVDGHVVQVDTRPMHRHEAPYELVKTMRASILALGPLVDSIRAQPPSTFWIVEGAGGQLEPGATLMSITSTNATSGVGLRAWD